LGASKNGWALRKLLLLLIANHAAPCGVAWIAQRRLVEETEVNRGTVITALSDLEQCGSIRRIERRRPNGSRTSDIIILAPDGDRGGMVTPQQDDLPEGVWVPLMNAGIFSTTNVASSNVASANVGQLPNPQKSRAADSLVLSEPVATHR
jgi:DNA-binding transcriptional MocR family regulator